MSNTALVLGVNISISTLPEIFLDVTQRIKYKEKSVIAYANIHALMLAHKDKRFCDFLNSSTYVICDGFGVKLAASILDQPSPPRNTPPDWIEKLSALSENEGYSMYFIGGKLGIAEKSAIILRRHFPDLKICGTHDGYFNKEMQSNENLKVITEISKNAPDILIVGFGMPIQEFWIEENWDKLNFNVAILVGAMFDYISGETKRAPKWMTDHGLEWLGRLIIEPKRLWHRYLIELPYFFFLVFKEKITGKSSKGHSC